MIVEALCLQDAWDSAACRYYERGKTYSIDTESEVAHLTVRPLSSGKVDKTTGEIVPVKPTRSPLPVFQFDRAAPLGAFGSGIPNDYTCKKCGKRCKSFHELGTHSNKEHPERPFEDGTEEEEAVALAVHTCKVCDPPQKFSSRSELMKHKGKAHGANFFKKKTEIEAETAVPA